MRLFTIGFTRSSAAHFFQRLQQAKVRTLVDVRLNNVSQLAGFAKRDDLAYFAKTICGITTEEIPALAPTQAMLDAYRKQQGGKTEERWRAYADSFRRLIARRRIETIDRARLDGACLLCSEDQAHHCHRRLVAEYLREKWGDVEIEHL